MKPFLITIVVAVLSVMSVAQVAPSCPVRNSISVTGEGQYETDPDVAVVSLTISTQEKQLKDAYAKATRAADQIRDALRSQGIDPKEAQIGFFQVAPVYEYGKRRKTVGYGVQSNITLKVKDFSKLPALTDALSSIDVAGDQSVSYQVADMAAAKNKAIENATQNARRNAETVASTSGSKLGELMTARVETRINLDGIRPRPMMAMEVAKTTDAPPPPPVAEFGPGKVKVNADVTLEFALVR